MNFDFYIFGTPDGHKQYSDRGHEELFKQFAQIKHDNSQLVIYRDNELAYYSYVHYLSDKNADNYFGISLIFNGVYCTAPDKFFKFFADTFDSILQKGEILKGKIGNINFVTDNFRNEHAEIEQLRQSFQNYIDNQLNNDFLTLDNSFERGYKNSKELSLLDGNEIINATLRKYQKIVIAPNRLTQKQIKRKHRIQFSIASVLLGLVIGLGIWGIEEITRKNENKSISVTHNTVTQNETTYIYSGTMLNNLPNGKGTAEYPDGSIYEGDFQNGMRHGKGKMIFPDGVTTYEGDYVDDKAEGYGEKRYRDGSYYKGEWKNDKQNGHGVFYDSSTGGEPWSGQWENGSLKKDKK